MGEFNDIFWSWALATTVSPLFIIKDESPAIDILTYQHIVDEHIKGQFRFEHNLSESSLMPARHPF